MNRRKAFLLLQKADNVTLSLSIPIGLCYDENKFKICMRQSVFINCTCCAAYSAFSYDKRGKRRFSWAGYGEFWLY